MNIKRNVNGQEMEFELTSEEMYKAFYEQQNQFYKDDIISTLYLRGLVVTDEQMVEIIERYDDNLSEDESWRYAAEEAIYAILNATK